MGKKRERLTTVLRTAAQSLHEYSLKKTAVADNLVELRKKRLAFDELIREKRERGND